MEREWLQQRSRPLRLHKTTTFPPFLRPATPRSTTLVTLSLPPFLSQDVLLKLPKQGGTGTSQAL